MPGLQLENERTLESLILRHYVPPMHNGIRQRYPKLVETNTLPQGLGGSIQVILLIEGIPEINIGHAGNWQWAAAPVGGQPPCFLACLLYLLQMPLPDLDAGKSSRVSRAKVVSPHLSG
jgi:hypothetical protein